MLVFIEVAGSVAELDFFASSSVIMVLSLALLTGSAE